MIPAWTPRRRMCIKHRTASLAIAASLLAPSWAGAQSFRDAVISLASQRPDLDFPADATALSAFGGLGMAIYKPAGAGPFPALVILHSCGGIRSEIRDWAKEALARGYVAFVLDSLGPRKVREVCVPSQANAGLNAVRGAKDVFQAVEHLGRFPFVDRQRIGLLGFSWGAIVGLLASGASYREALASSETRYAAFVGFYPICFLPANAAPGRRDIEFVRPDHEAPALVLLADQDTEAPASECVPRLQALKDKGVAIDWHLYPGATHCWDCSSLNGLSKVDFMGNRVVYRYDKAVTADSIRRTFEHFDAHLKPR